ncbi:unnamed protein product [Cuscuta epithymum]|uniref:Uncharacterized protein n=1 Tax=Cuscuta epithymum TaxID=186058 RepID=A0AAV0FH98_9ASTE|nr:unnamed protein product [Cuscuta epithymum]
MAAGVTKLGTALSVVFVAFLLALFAQLILVLCHRRRRRCTDLPVTGDAERAPTSSSASKVLFMFFCLGTDTHASRVEPSATPMSLHESTWPTPEPPEMDLVDLLKLSGGLHGPSKILFTIKEEEKEDLESVCSNSAEKGLPKRIIKNGGEDGGRSLEQCFDMEPQVVRANDDDSRVDVETTPFCTPCTSPSYFTPSASPARLHSNIMPPPAAGR